MKKKSLDDDFLTNFTAMLQDSPRDLYNFLQVRYEADKSRDDLLQLMLLAAGQKEPNDAARDCIEVAKYYPEGSADRLKTLKLALAYTARIKRPSSATMHADDIAELLEKGSPEESEAFAIAISNLSQPSYHPVLAVPELIIIHQKCSHLPDIATMAFNQAIAKAKSGDTPDCRSNGCMLVAQSCPPDSLVREDILNYAMEQAIQIKDKVKAAWRLLGIAGLCEDGGIMQSVALGHAFLQATMIDGAALIFKDKVSMLHKSDKSPAKKIDALDRLLIERHGPMPSRAKVTAFLKRFERP